MTVPQPMDKPALGSSMDTPVAAPPRGGAVDALRRGNACAGFSDEDFQRLADAARTLLDSQNTVVKLAAYVGEGVEALSSRVLRTQIAGRIGKAIGVDLERRMRELIETALWDAHKVATFGLAPSTRGAAPIWMHRALATASGAAGGFFGAAGGLVDVGATTGLILRSIAQIAREHEGEDLASEDTRRACIEVFAFGGPGSGDDEVDSGFWATRLSLSHLVLNELIKFTAARLGITLTAKFMAQSVPVVGAVSGAGINFIFVRHYQQMARVHFTLRELERRYGDAEGVRACFDRLVEDAKSGRRLGRREREPETS
jgi:hypothetical protein